MTKILKLAFFFVSTGSAYEKASNVTARGLSFLSWFCNQTLRFSVPVS